MLVGGGQGASHRQDGKPGLIWPSSAANTSVEMVESRLPVLILQKALIPDSGGAGQFRGGLGQSIKLRLLANRNESFFVNVYPEGDGVTTDGLQGGGPGGVVRAFLSSEDTGSRQEHKVGAVIELVSTRDVVEVQLGGGAGFGLPTERDAKRLESDVLNGYVTPEFANKYQRLSIGTQS